MSSVTAVRNYDGTATTAEPDAVVPSKRGRRMTKLLSKSKSLPSATGKSTSATTREDRKRTTAVATAGDSQRRKQHRSKSPFKRLLRRTFSRSPQRRRSTSTPGAGTRFQREYDNDVDVTMAPEGEGSNSTSLRDDPTYMVDPVGELRLKRRPGGRGGSVGSSSYTSRSDSLYDSDTSSLNSYEQAQRSRPRLDVRAYPGYPHEGTTIKPNSRHEPRELLSSVQEGVSSTPALPERKSSSSSRPLRKISNSQVVWKKYAEPNKKHSTRRATSSSGVPGPLPASSGASTTSSSLCSDASLVTRILLLLLHPESKFFEIIQLVFTPETATVGDLLDSIPAQATETKLVQQQYIGLVRAARHSASWTERGQPASEAYIRLSTMPAAGIVPGDVLVAIPDGYQRRHVLRLGLQILDSPRIKNLLVDKFRSEVNVPTTITTTTMMSPAAPAQTTSSETAPSQPPLKSALRRTTKNGRARSPSPDEFLMESGTRTPTRRNPRRKVDLDNRDPTPPPPLFFERNTVEGKSAAVVAVAAAASGGTRTSPSSLKGRNPTPPPPAFFDRLPGTPPLAPQLEAVEVASPPKRVPVQPISAQSLLAADAIRRDDSSTWSDSNGNLLESGSALEQVLKESDLLEADEDLLEMKVDASDVKEEPVQVGLEPVVPREVACDPETIEPTLSHDEEPAIAMPTLEDESGNETETAKVETNPPSPQTTSYCIAASLSPVRRRINELEEKIAVCPVVPVPEVGPHNFPLASDASEGSSGQNLIGTVVEKCDSNELPDLTKEPGSGNLGDADSVLSMDLMSEHKEIIREALAQLDALPSRPGQSLEMFLKCRSLSHSGKESTNVDADNDGGIDNDDKSSGTNTTGDSRGAAVAAVGGQYEEGSIDESYSAWSNSVDSSLVSRYSLLSHSNRSSMTTEEAQECQIRAKKMRLRRRQKARLRRSLKKLAAMSLAIIIFLYWVDTKSQQWFEGTAILSSLGGSSLGFFGILQFVVALLTLVKVQILWKKSMTLKIENKSCPFLDATHTAVIGRFTGKTQKAASVRRSFKTKKKYS